MGEVLKARGTENVMEFPSMPQRGFRQASADTASSEGAQMVDRDLLNRLHRLGRFGIGEQLAERVALVQAADGVGEQLGHRDDTQRGQRRTHLRRDGDCVADDDLANRAVL